MTDLSFVKIERLPFGISQFSGCTVDIFEPDTLTVTRTDTEQVIATFAPGRWATASVMDGRGNPLASFVSKVWQADEDRRLAQALARVWFD